MLPKPLEHRPITDYAIRLLAPPGTPRKDLVALFGNRVGYEAIKAWRTGHRPMPAWARAVLIEKLDQFAETRDALAAMPNKKNPAT